MHYISLKYFFSSVIEKFFVPTIVFASHFPYIVYGLIRFTFIDLFNDDHLTNLYQFFHIQ
jgi:hypothetical protein